MKRFVCIHGHFYQPPRENPWLEEVETEDTAYPYHDWNQRITAECYAPNTASRILDSRDYILDILNNYVCMSFNFGPTLLSWLEGSDPEIYQTILGADLESSRHFGGHGSALAQAYNHTILPLASSRDKRTQILWGFEDFVHRFGRDPEGMWLPETAVDLETLEIMAESGIRFTILAPHQAARVRNPGEKNWQSVRGGRIDPRKPYLCRLPSGRNMALFFYDGAIAREVAFGELLKTGIGFAERLCQGFGPTSAHPELIHIATDGETYGHHHRFGEMALSFVFHHLESQEHVRVCNYSEYLAEHPPEDEVEILENTSWSCPHGVERWRADCGCHSGAHPEWTQAWRGPLRVALDELRLTLDPAYEKAMRAFGSDPWDLRDKYIHVILARSEKSRHDFLTLFGLQDVTPEQRIGIWKWLELQKCLQMVYTSCGWFFDEVSGIETVQVMRYAARSLQLARELGVPDPEPVFQKQLTKAPSNRNQFSHAADVYGSQVRPEVLDLHRIAAHHAVAAVFLEAAENQEKPSYSLSFSRLSRYERQGWKLAIGHLTLQSRLTEEQLDLNFASFYLGGHDVFAAVGPVMSESAFDQMVKSLESEFLAGNTEGLVPLLDRLLEPEWVGLPHLYKDTKREIVSRLLETILEEFKDAVRPIYAKDFDFIQAVHSMNVPLPSALIQAVGYLRHQEIYRLLERPDPDITELRSFAGQIKNEVFDLDQKTMGPALSRTLERILGKIDQDPEDSASLRLLDAIIAVVDDLPLELNLWKSQNRFFYLRKGWFNKLKIRERTGDLDAKADLACLRRIGDYLRVRSDT